MDSLKLRNLNELTPSLFSAGCDVLSAPRGLEDQVGLKKHVCPWQPLATHGSEHCCDTHDARASWHIGISQLGNARTFWSSMITSASFHGARVSHPPDLPACKHRAHLSMLPAIREKGQAHCRAPALCTAQVYFLDRSHQEFMHPSANRIPVLVLDYDQVDP